MTIVWYMNEEMSFLPAIIIFVILPACSAKIGICRVGKRLEEYNSNTHLCKNGTLVEKLTPIPPNTTNTTPPTQPNTPSTSSPTQPNATTTTPPTPQNTTSTSPPRYTGHCDGPEDELRCGEKVECGKVSGRRCCGSKSYLPAEKTCCIRMQYERAIFNVPGKTSVCCWRQSFVLVDQPRGKKFPCQQPASNGQNLRQVSLIQVLKVWIGGKLL